MTQPSTDNRDVWVVVPTYNEAPVVQGVVKDLRRFFPNIVGVDDGSADDSAGQLAAGGAWVVRHAVNLGAGAALQTGLQFALLDADARFFVTFDADGQHQTDDAVAMVERLRVESYDVLIGSRFLGRSEAMPVSRRLLLQAGRIFEWTTSGVRLTDAHNGLRAFTRRFAETVDLRLSDMAHASELLGLIGGSGLPYAEHPTTVLYSDYSLAKGQRSINSVNIAMDVWLNLFLRGRRR